MTCNNLSFLMFMLFTKYKYFLEQRLSLAMKDSHGVRLTWKYTCWNPFVEGYWLHLKFTQATPCLPRATKNTCFFPYWAYLLSSSPPAISVFDNIQNLP
jgi:hypothetical protein